MPQFPEDSNSKMRAYTRYAGIGFQMLAVIGLGTWGGIKLDERLNSGHTFTIILSLISVFLGLGLVIREFLKKPRSKNGSQEKE